MSNKLFIFRTANESPLVIGLGENVTDLSLFFMICGRFFFHWHRWNFSLFVQSRSRVSLHCKRLLTSDLSQLTRVNDVASWF